MLHAAYRLEAGEQIAIPSSSSPSEPSHHILLCTHLARASAALRAPSASWVSAPRQTPLVWQPLGWPGNCPAPAASAPADPPCRPVALSLCALQPGASQSHSPESEQTVTGLCFWWRKGGRGAASLNCPVCSTHQTPFFHTVLCPFFFFISTVPSSSSSALCVCCTHVCVRGYIYIPL